MEAQRDAAQFAARNGRSLAEDSIYAIRELLNAHNVPLSAFIDDHVGNVIVQRNSALARLEEAKAVLAEVSETGRITSGGVRRPAKWISIPSEVFARVRAFLHQGGPDAR
jgi:hypothetical protein